MSIYYDISKILISWTVVNEVMEPLSDVLKKDDA